jgi:hypothetical protein
LEITIGLLIAAFLISNGFWAYVCHKFVNKIMSRDFYGYTQAKQVPQTQKDELKKALAEVKVAAPRQQNELDSLDEMISKVMPLG